MAAPRSAAASPSGTRRTLTSREIEALRQFLETNDAGPPATAGARAARPTPARAGAARPPARRPARGSARRRAHAARAARRRVLLRTGRVWSLRVVRLTVCAAAVPLVLTVVVPGPSLQPAPGSADATALALTAQTTLLRSAETYRRLETEIAQRQAVLQQAVTAETAARAALTDHQQLVGRSAAAAYVAGPQDRYAVLAAVPAELPGALRTTEQLRTTLRQAELRVGAARSAVDTATVRADRALASARSTAARLGPEVSATLAGLSSASAPGPQQARNAQALARWQEYLRQLTAAGIEPPPAAAVADLDHLPDGFTPALDRAGHRVPGVVWAVIGNHPVTVLPAETVAAVSTALSQLGKPYTLRASGPDAYDCAGFTASSWLLAGYPLGGTPQEQWATGAAVDPADLQIGDLVFSPGGQDVGLYLGNGDVLGASAGSAQVVVRDLQPGSSGVRVPLPRPAGENTALPGAAGAGYCGAPLNEPSNPAWGGWSNGRIPLSALCPLSAAGQALRCDAAAAYEAMSTAYAATFGSPICITDSYRPYATQVTAFREKPALAAVPGTSNHGWALAVDLCAGINVAGSPQWSWMQANAPRFGFLNPPWAQPSGEKPEPWHWEFGNFG